MDQIPAFCAGYSFANTLILHQMQLQGGGRGMEKSGDHNLSNYVAANYTVLVLLPVLLRPAQCPLDPSSAEKQQSWLLIAPRLPSTSDYPPGLLLIFPVCSSSTLSALIYSICPKLKYVMVWRKSVIPLKFLLDTA